MLKIIARTLTLCCLVYLLLIGFILIKLQHNAQSIPVTMLENVLSDQEVRVKINSISAIWDKNYNSINIIFNDVKRIDSKNSAILEHLPNATLEIPLKSLFPFTKSYKKVIIHDAEVTLNNVLEQNVAKNYQLIRFLEILVELKNIKLHILNNGQLTDWVLDSDFKLRRKNLFFNNVHLKNNNKAYLRMQGALSANNVDLSVQISNLPLNNIYQLWPKWLMKNVYQFVTSAITTGVITEFEGKILYKSHKKYAKHNKISANATLNNISLIAHQNLPPITQLSAKLTLDNNQMSIAIANAKIANSVISKTTVLIPYSFDLVEVKGQVSGLATDLFSFVPDKQLALIKDYDLNINKIKGEALTQVNKLTIPCKDNLEPYEIGYDVKTTLSNINWQVFPKLSMIQNGNLTLDFNGEVFNMQGDVKLNDNNSYLKWSGYVPENAIFDCVLEIDAKLTPQHSPIILFDEPLLKSGTIDHSLKMFSKAGVIKSKIKTDFTKGTVSLKNLGFYKPIGESLVLNADAKFNNKNISVNNISLAGHNTIEIKGVALINKKDFGLDQLKLANIKFNRNNFSIDFNRSNDETNTIISGKMIDLSNSDLGKFFDKAGSSNSRFSLNVAEVLMKNNVILSEFSTNINCTKLFGCLNGEMSARINNNYKLQGILIPKVDNIATLRITSDNASLLSKAFNIYKDLDGGSLEIKGTLQNQTAQKPASIDGTINIRNFAVTKTSIFSRIISITSVPGLMNLFSKGNIDFNSMNLDFSANQSKIKIKNGKMSGTQMDMTLEGTIDLEHEKLNLNGALIPGLFTINKVLSSIPVLGTILKGSNKEGIISLSYAVRGTFAKPDIDANPFTITPGFIKSMFNFVGKPAAKLIVEEERNEDKANANKKHHKKPQHHQKP